jgi:hypothetical protein
MKTIERFKKDYPLGIPLLLFALVFFIFAMSSCKKDTTEPVTPANSELKSIGNDNKDAYYSEVQKKAIETKTPVYVLADRFTVGHIIGNEVQWKSLNEAQKITLQSVTWGYISQQFNVGFSQIIFDADNSYLDYPGYQPDPCPDVCDIWYMVFNTGNSDVQTDPRKQIIYLIYPYYLALSPDIKREVILVLNPVGDDIMLDVNHIYDYRPLSAKSYATGTSIYFSSKKGYTVNKIKTKLQ